MTDSIRLRQATLADLAVLETFEQGVITAERPFDPTLGPDPIRYYDLSAFLQADDVYVVIAEDGDVAVASGYIRILDGKPKHAYDRFGYIGFMYVTPEYRGRGFNKLVIARLLDWAKEQGITEVKLDVYADNAAAIRAYEKAGFSKNLVNMRIELDESSD